MMRLKLVFDSSIPVSQVRCDLQAVKRYFSRLEEHGILCEFKDISSKPQNEVYDIYSDAIVPSVMKKVGIRRVFGSKRQSAFLFGKQVPALLVYQDATVDDVYPQIRNWAERQELVTIERHLEDLLKLFELSVTKWYVVEASRALASSMPRYAVMCSMFALEAFVWRVLWGKQDLEVVWTDCKRHMISSVDFVYLYARKSKKHFSNREEFERYRELNKGLFDKLRNADDFLLSRAVAIDVISEAEACLVRDIRTIRNFYSHFNPFEATLRNFRETVQRLGLNIDLSDRQSESDVAKAVVVRTSELLSTWEKRVVSSALQGSSIDIPPSSSRAYHLPH